MDERVRTSLCTARFDRKNVFATRDPSKIVCDVSISRM